jgi:hypothetical protein
VTSEFTPSVRLVQDASAAAWLAVIDELLGHAEPEVLELDPTQQFTPYRELIDED